MLILFLHLHGLQTQINHTTISKKILYFSKGEVCPFFRTHLIFFQIPQYLVVKIQTSTYLVRIREPIIYSYFILFLCCVFWSFAVVQQVCVFHIILLHDRGTSAPPAYKAHIFHRKYKFHVEYMGFICRCVCWRSAMSFS